MDARKSARIVIQSTFLDSYHCVVVQHCGGEPPFIHGVPGRHDFNSPFMTLRRHITPSLPATI